MRNSARRLYARPLAALWPIYLQALFTSSDMDLRMLAAFPALWLLLSPLLRNRLWLKGLSMARTSVLASEMYRGAYVACMRAEQ